MCLLDKRERKIKNINPVIPSFLRFLKGTKNPGW